MVAFDIVTDGHEVILKFLDDKESLIKVYFLAFKLFGDWNQFHQYHDFDFHVRYRLQRK